jgi:cytochrome bd ubiquinol oxidase subunit I
VAKRPPSSRLGDAAVKVGRQEFGCKFLSLVRPDLLGHRTPKGAAVAVGVTTTYQAFTTIAAANPVPWARSQMAFTLMCHIILVPLGVSWAFMTLVANYKAVRHQDKAALQLAQRWSKYMAVTFAVGAVSGTVLTFEFGLLWPRFMGQWGGAFGVPFAFEGIFFFLEAIFISIYIFGWRRLRPWPHFWTGVPVVLTGILGSMSVVAANAWMNSPSGFTLNSSGKVVDVDPIDVIFNKAMPLEAAHMLVAAYLVGGFLIASVYAVGMLRGRQDRYHRLGFAIAFTVAAVATPIQMGVGDSLARWVYNNQPEKFAAIELEPTTSSDVPETLLGHLNSNGKESGGIKIPGLASWLSDPSTGKATVVQGLDSVPADERPTVRETNIVHLAWDVMVGLASLLLLLVLWYGASWVFRRRMPASRWFLRASASAGVLAVIAMEAGWVVTEVGRQPWIVYQHMKVQEAATANTGVWITFIAVVLVYLAVGLATLLVLRAMSRRFRRTESAVDEEGPYSPTAPISVVEEPVA